VPAAAAGCRGVAAQRARLPPHGSRCRQFPLRRL